jgi:TonB family protein
MNALLIAIAATLPLSASFAQTTSTDGTDSDATTVAPQKPASCEDAKRVIAHQTFPEKPTAYSFTIKTDGSLTDVAVKSSSGNETLDQMGAACVLRWHYKPGMKDGKPVETPWQAQIIWKQMH